MAGERNTISWNSLLFLAMFIKLTYAPKLVANKLIGALNFLEYLYTVFIVYAIFYC